MKFYRFLYCESLIRSGETLARSTSRVFDRFAWRGVSRYSSSTEALWLCVCMSDPKDAYARTPLELRINFISIIQNFNKAAEQSSALQNCFQTKPLSRKLRM